MRELKFRAWLADEKAMVEWNPMFFSDMSPVTHYGNEFPTGEDTVIMQYTGLKDKNGREIYAGDVIEFQYLTHMLRGVVAWHDRGACWLTSSFPGGGIPTHGEVIGNIHENPELMEGDNG